MLAARAQREAPGAQEEGAGEQDGHDAEEEEGGLAALGRHGRSVVRAA